jgi:hypothetical protein
MTRGLSSLARNNWAAAIYFNALSPLVFAILCAAVVAGLWRLSGLASGREVFSERLRGKFWGAVVVVFVGYGVLRLFALMP